jgi:DNA-directed RNA polymerase subunit RPC12/RpoP
MAKNVKTGTNPPVVKNDAAKTRAGSTAAQLLVMKNPSPEISSPRDYILHLQQKIGNRAVERLWRSGQLQRKLNIGPANDKYEQEADAIADKVVSMNPSAEFRASETNDSSSNEHSAKSNPTISRSPLINSITPLQRVANEPVLRQAQEPESQEKQPDEEVQDKYLQRETDPEDEEVQGILRQAQEPIQREAAPEDEEVQGKFLQREVVPEDEEAQGKLIQRQDDSGKATEESWSHVYGGTEINNSEDYVAACLSKQVGKNSYVKVLPVKSGEKFITPKGWDLDCFIRRNGTAIKFSGVFAYIGITKEMSKIEAESAFSQYTNQAKQIFKKYKVPRIEKQKLQRLVLRREVGTEDEEAQGKLIQRTCASCQKEFDNSEVQRRPVTVNNLCPTCRSETLFKKRPVDSRFIAPTLQKTPAFTLQRTLRQGSGQTLQRKEAGITAPSNVESAIHSARSGGKPLSTVERSYYEPRFGADFSGVKIHTGSNAADLSRSVNARAFTVGRDIFFGGGEYSPNTLQGKKLMAHELTHTVQQTGRKENHSTGYALYRKPEAKDIENEMKQVAENEMKQVADELKALGAEVLLDVCGIFEPTPFCDSASMAMAISRRDYLSAALSSVSFIPYLGDFVAKPLKGWRISSKVGKLLKKLEKLKKILETIKPNTVTKTLKKSKSVLKRKTIKAKSQKTKGKKKKKKEKKKKEKPCPATNVYGKHEGNTAEYAKLDSIPTGELDRHHMPQKKAIWAVANSNLFEGTKAKTLVGSDKVTKEFFCLHMGRNRHKETNTYGKSEIKWKEDLNPTHPGKDAKNQRIKVLNQLKDFLDKDTSAANKMYKFNNESLKNDVQNKKCREKIISKVNKKVPELFTRNAQKIEQLNEPL